VDLVAAEVLAALAAVGRAVAERAAVGKLEKQECTKKKT
jgi:hypothetical protein